jgi:hypothetical protein
MFVVGFLRYFLLLLLVGLLGAPAAAAHGIGSSSRFETTIDAVAPAVRGLTVRGTRAAGRLELANETGEPVAVLRRDGSPFVRVAPNAAAEWHDARADPPASVSGGARRRVLSFRIPLRVGDRSVVARGHVTYVPGRRSLVKLGAALGGIVLVAALAASAFWTRRGADDA